MTLTLENVPMEVNRALRRRARSEGRPVDQVTVDVINAGLSIGVPPAPQRGRVNRPANRSAVPSLRQLNKKMNSDPKRLMRLAEANARRLVGKSHL